MKSLSDIDKQFPVEVFLAKVFTLGIVIFILLVPVVVLWLIKVMILDWY